MSRGNESEQEARVMPEQKCVRCDGCGKIWGHGKDEIPGSEAMKIPLQSALGVIMFPPRICPDCGGSGKENMSEKDTVSDT